MTKKLLEIASEIVQTQVSTRQMSSDEIVLSLRQVFNALQGMQKSETEGTYLDLGKALEDLSMEGKAGDKIEPKDSIQDDRIICLECGAEMRQLTTKHLSSHGLNPREYKKKWGIPLTVPLSARSLTNRRRKLAKELGMGKQLAAWRAKRKKSA